MAEDRAAGAGGDRVRVFVHGDFGSYDGGYEYAAGIDDAKIEGPWAIRLGSSAASGYWRMSGLEGSWAREGDKGVGS